MALWGKRGESYGLSASGASMKLPAKSYVEVFGYSPAIVI